MKTKAYRAVGNALKNNPYAPKVPCHRVINSNGTIGGYKGKKNSKEKIRRQLDSLNRSYQEGYITKKTYEETKQKLEKSRKS